MVGELKATNVAVPVPRRSKLGLGAMDDSTATLTAGREVNWASIYLGGMR